MRRTLELRVKEVPASWTKVWKISMWVHLAESDHTEKLKGL